MGNKKLRLLRCMLLLAALIACLAPTVFAATSGTFAADGVNLTYSYSTAETAIQETNVLGRKYQSEENGVHSVTLDESEKKFTLTATNSTYYTKKIAVMHYYYCAQNYSVALTLTNNTGNTLKINYTVAGDMDTHNAGNYTATLLNGASLEFSLRTKVTDAETKEASTLTGAVTLNSVSVVKNVDVQFAPSSRGDYTYTMSGSSVTVAADGEVSDTYSVSFGTQVTLKRGTAKSDYCFYGWMAGNAFLGTSDGIYTIEDDAIIYPVYLTESEMAADAPFKVGSNYYRIWQAAFSDAVTSGNTVVLNRNYTLPATLEDAGLIPTYTSATYVSCVDGALTYKIPYGAKLLIPYDDDCTLVTNEPELHENTYTKPTVYRKLTMESKTHISNSGTICVGSAISSRQGYNGSPSGTVGYVEMEKDSSITVNSGAYLYCWGYITGAGTVMAKSGSVLYECFQIADWRGGNATSSMNGNDNKVLPMSQYYIQNIEVAVTYESGATEYGAFAVTVSSLSRCPTDIPLIGSTSGLFRIASGGTLTKTYDGSTDRTTYDISGNISVESFSLTIEGLVGIIGNVKLNTADYVLPITSNMTVNCLAGSTVNVAVDMAILPGCVIKIAKDATMTVTKSMIVYDLDEWKGKGYVSSASDLHILCYVPTRSYTRTSADLVDGGICVNGILDASKGSLYTTNSGANIYSTGSGNVKTTAGTTTVTYQVTQSNTSVTYVSIDVTAAKLLNGDGSGYVETAGSTDTTFDYSAEHKRWVAGGHNFGVWTEVDDTNHQRTCDCDYVETGEHSYDAETGLCVCGKKKPETSVTYSVTISWEQTGTAKYTEGTTTYRWDAQNVKWVENGKTDGNWSGASVVTVKIENTGTGTVKASYSYANADGFTADTSGFDQITTVSGGNNDSATLTVKPTGGTIDKDNTTIGEITITLTTGG